MIIDKFQTWTEYFGPLLTVTDTMPDGSLRESTLYGFETVSEEHAAATDATIIETRGAVFGYVSEGTVMMRDYTHKLEPVTLVAGQYFAVSAPVTFLFNPDEPARLVAIHTTDFVPLRTIGGPVEPKGRLRYIDRCSDTLLISPPRLGDPCLNLLHFPPGIHQTAHTHPSVPMRRNRFRSRLLHRRRRQPPRPTPRHDVDYPKDVVHSFHTADSGDNLNVIAFHPDTDWGPEDETHPMLNRTWVDGTKIDNTTEQHANPDVMVFD
jgi:hypothetical protein